MRCPYGPNGEHTEKLIGESKQCALCGMILDTSGNPLGEVNKSAGKWRPKTANELLRERSGQVGNKSDLVAFLYELMRDHLPPGKVEELVRNSVDHQGERWEFTNGYLAMYADDLARRLTFIR